MAKADPKHNYYADLEVGEKCELEEIKRQFRKLAKAYHPDRNPGKELEVIPKFQAIQAAHEILGDPDQRLKYDQDRQKRQWGSPYGRAPGHSRYPSAGAGPRPQPPPPQYRGPPRPEFTSTATSGANRFSRFPQPPPQTSAQADAEARAKTYKAWRQFSARGQNPPAPGTNNASTRPRTQEESFRGQQTAAEAFKRTQTQQKPGVYRSQTTRAPKAGYNPQSPGLGEGQAKGPSSYFHGSHDMPPPPRASPDYHRAPPPTAKRPANEGLRPPLNTDVPYFEGEPRLRTPYASNTGEKTYFSTEAIRRSASQRDGKPMDAPENVFARTAPRPAPTSRPRSASPPRQRSYSEDHSAPSKNQPPPAGETAPRHQSHSHVSSGAKFYMDSASEGSEEKIASDADRAGQNHDTAASVNQRRKAQPSPSWKKFSNQGPKADQEAQPNGAAQGMEQTSHSTMYDQFSSSSNSWSQCWPFGSAQKHDGAPKPPYWAYPSSVSPPSQPSSKGAGRRASGKSDAFSTKAPKLSPSASARQTISPAPRRGRGGGSRADGRHGGFPSRFFSPSLETLPEQPNKANDDPASSFNQTNENDGASPGRRGEFKSRSSDSIGAKFSPSNWSGKFSDDTFAPRPTNGATSSASRERPSKPAQASPKPFASHAQEEPEQSPRTAHFPPPPPNPPPQSQKGPIFPPKPGEAKFPAEEWAKTLQDAKWVYNAPPTKSTSPVRGGSGARQPRATKPRTPFKGTSRPATNARPASKSDAAAAAPDGGANGKTAEAESSDGSAMDIDVEEPWPNGAPRGPRLVNIPPLRPEWRDKAGNPTTHPPPPPPGPPPTSQTSAAPSTAPHAGAANGISLNSFKHVSPFAPSNTGLKDLKDLGTTLPFESRSATSRPPSTATATSAAALSLPAPPPAPDLPAAPTPAAWRDYVERLRAYLGEWNRFEAAMTAHFGARQALLDGLLSGDGTAWLEPVSSNSGQGSEGELRAKGGCEAYVEGLVQDEQVRGHWAAAAEGHRAVMERHVAAKEKVARDGL